MLEPCAQCRRLVRASDALCPFCGGDARGRTLAPPAGRHSRAALIATALVALGANACTPNSSPPEKTVVTTLPDVGAAPLVTVYGGPVAPDMIDAGSPLTMDASPPSPTVDAAAPMDGAAPKPPVPHASTSVRPPPTHAPITAYGAPPGGPTPKP